MEYLARLWLNKQQYLAVLDKALAIVTVDKGKNPVKYEIFEKGEMTDDLPESARNLLNQVSGR